MDFHEALQYVNVLMVPALIYIIKLERRIIKIETILEIFFKQRITERET